jgi:hypothetical protein
MAELKRPHDSYEMGMHTEQLAGRTQATFFHPAEEENFLYPDAPDVDFNKRTEFDAAPLDTKAINLEIRRLMNETDIFLPSAPLVVIIGGVFCANRSSRRPAGFSAPPSEWRTFDQVATVYVSMNSYSRTYV